MANEDKATRYHRLRRRAAVASTIVAALVLLLLTVTGLSAMMRNAAVALVGRSWGLTTIAYVIALVVVTEVAELPLSFYQGVTLERRYELSVEPTARWWIDRLKGLGVGLVLAVLGALIVRGLLLAMPAHWWIAAAAAFTLLLVVFAQLAPVLLMPVFYTFTPLDRPELVSRLMALAARAGTRVLGVFEWRLGDRTRKANAALTGIGRTRRILISDTLLAAHSDDEIEVILAHELAHHVHHDIWSGLAVETVLVTIGFYLADRVLAAFSGSFGLQGKSDAAALPLLVLTAGAVSLAFVPLVNALSRAHERRADRYALEMTGRADAFVSAMKRLASQNLAEEQPSRLVELLFHTHPSTGARIAAAHAWAAKPAGRSADRR
jgi:STE24 endopeptidase